MEHSERSMWPVVIAGGGPVGVTLAMDLARLGVEAVVLEQRHDQPPNPRCNTTNARSMEFLRRLGCADAVRRAGLPPDHCTDVVYQTQFTGPELTRYRRSTAGQIMAGQSKRASGWREDPELVAANWPTPEPQHYLSQLYLEPVLRRHAADHWGVELRQGWVYEGFEDNDDPAPEPATTGTGAGRRPGAPTAGVTVIARNLADGTRHELRAGYLVGTDGSNSIVRSGIGARLVGVPRLGDTVSTFFRSAHLAGLARHNPGWMFRFIGGATLVAINGSDEWLIHTPVPPGETRDGYDPEPAIFQAIGEPFAYEVLGRARWTPRAMVATKFREGRVFLAGDAAHLWIPMGGFGMNAGLGDAISLSWRLAGVMDGSLDPKILDSYETERAPLGARVAAQAATWGKDLRPLTRYSPERFAELNDSPDARARLGAEIRAINLGEFECPGFQLGYFYTESPVICHDLREPPPATTLETYVETTWPGVRLPHIWRADGRSIFDQLGPGFTLIRTPTGERTPQGRTLIEGAAARGVALEVLDVTEADAHARYGSGTLVLVRPDQHAVWRSAVEPNRAQADEVWDTVTGRAMSERTVREIEARPLADGFRFGEGLRWIDGRLVFSDMIGCRVLSVDPATGDIVTLHDVPGQPNGLGRLSDGRLIVASMLDRRLLATTTGDLSSPLVEYCDLSAVATGYLGDLTVDSADRIYVGDTGARVLHGEPIAATGRLIRVDGPGHHEVLLEHLAFPNGVVVDGADEMLYLGLSGERVVVQHRLWPDGGLGPARPFARQTPDGMVGDADGGVWVCHPGRGLVVRYDRAGRPTHHVTLTGARAISCALDPGATTLYVVAIDELAPGVNLFDAMPAGRTSGALWQASLAEQRRIISGKFPAALG